jgi:hypothetical protein
MTDITTTELAGVIEKMWETQEASMAALRSSMAMQAHHHEQDRRLLQAEIDSLKTQITYLKSEDSLDGGLLSSMQDISLLEIQIFHTEALTKKQRQGGHTEWSLRIRASVNGRKLKREINVALHCGPDFADKVFNTFDEIPPTIDIVARHASAEKGHGTLYGMFKQYTSGAGSPRSRRQFAILQGNLSE